MGGQTVMGRRTSADDVVRQSMLWYIMVCSMIGGISVSVTTGLGSAIVTTAMGDNQIRSRVVFA